MLSVFMKQSKENIPNIRLKSKTQIWPKHLTSLEPFPKFSEKTKQKNKNKNKKKKKKKMY